MAVKPKGDLGALLVPKFDDAPATTQEPPSAAPKGYAHTLSLRLTAEQYQSLRMFVRALEDRTGGRVTHQGIVESALTEYIERHR